MPRFLIFFAFLVVLLFPKLTQAQSAAEANLLFGQAVALYEQAEASSDAERARLLLQVAEILEQISVDYPDSIPAKFMAEGKQLGPIDMDIVAGAAKSPVQELPSSTLQAIDIVSRQACQGLVAGCIGEVAEGLTEFILNTAFKDIDRAVDIEKLQWLFSNPGQITSKIERVELFEEMIEDSAFLQELDSRLRVSEFDGVAREASVDIAMGLTTAVVTEVLAQHYESQEQIEAARFTRTWLEPLVDISLVLEGASTATTASAGVGAAVIWAKNAYAFVQLGQATLDAEATGATKEAQLEQIASDIEALHDSLLTGRLTGPMFEGHEGEIVTERMARAFLQTLEDNYELQKWWLTSNEAILLDTFSYVLDVAKATALALSADPGQPSGTEHANSTKALPNSIVPMTASTPVGAKPEVWHVADKPDLVLKPGAEGLGLSVAADGSTTFRNNSVVFTRAFEPAATEVWVYKSNDNGSAAIIQRDWDRGGLRFALLDLVNGKVVSNNLISEGQVVGQASAKDARWLMGPAVWSPDDRYVVINYSEQEWQADLAIVDRGSGAAAFVRPNGVSDEVWAWPQIETLRAEATGLHSIEFQLLQCADDRCQTPEEFDKRRIGFQLTTEPSPSRENRPQASDGLSIFDRQGASPLIGTFEHGPYPAVCSDDGTNRIWEQLIVRVEEDHFEYSPPESSKISCRLEQPIQSGARTHSTQASCFAEGTNWRAMLLLQLGADENLSWELDGNRSDGVYRRCPEEADLADTQSEWGPEIVVDGENSVWSRRNNGSADPIEDLRSHNVQDDAIRFSAAYASPHPAGDALATAFVELGKVDLVKMGLARQAGTSDRFRAPAIVNGAPDVIPVRGADINLSVGFRDDASRSILSRYPGAAPSYFGVHHRMLPSQVQRFVVMTDITTGCRVCPSIAAAVQFWDIGPDGRILKKKNVGLMDGKALEKVFVSELTMNGGGTGWERTDFGQHPNVLQYRLNSLGYDAGQMDGYPGPQTRQALMEFQAENCLPATGQPDRATNAALQSATGVTSPCVGKTLPPGISANAPLLSGKYVHDLDQCTTLETTPWELLWEQVLIDGTGVTLTHEYPCTTRRTDLRDGVTLFRGTCSFADQTWKGKWSFDIRSSTEFIYIDWGNAEGTFESKRFMKCPHLVDAK